jgi:hypothetical protein
MNLPYNQMDLTTYNVFVFEHINTTEYVLFTCSYDKDIKKIGQDGSIYTPINFSNKYIKSLLEQKITFSQSNPDQIYESNIIYNQEMDIGTRPLGQIEFKTNYTKSTIPIQITPYTVTNSTGMFAGISKIIIDSTLPTCKIYFVKGLDYF